MRSAFFRQLPEDVMAQLVSTRESRTSVSLQSNEPEVTVDSEHTESAVRVVGRGRVSAAATTRSGDEEGAMRRALGALPYGSRASYRLPGDAFCRRISLTDESVMNVAPEDMAEIVGDLASSLRRFDPGIRVEASVSRLSTNETLVNSEGFRGSFARTLWRAHLGGRRVEGDDMLRLAEARDGCRFRDAYEDLKQEVRWEFERARDVIPVRPGRYAVIFAPAQVVFLLRPLVRGLKGNMIADGLSPWGRKLGETVLDPAVTLLDDGVAEMHPASRPFDREGVPVTRRELISAGVPRGALLDLESAQRLGKEPTGNGYPGGQTPGPRPNHLVLVRGNQPLSDLLRQVGDGLLILASIGAWAGNPFSGNVSGTISLGYRIRKGEVIGRVKDCMFSLNAFDHFGSSLIDLSHEIKSSSSGYTFPYVALDDVVISSSPQ